MPCSWAKLRASSVTLRTNSPLYVGEFLVPLLPDSGLTRRSTRVAVVRDEEAEVAADVGTCKEIAEEPFAAFHASQSIWAFNYT